MKPILSMPRLRGLLDDLERGLLERGATVRLCLLAALTDPLTGLGNRRALTELVAKIAVTPSTTGQ